MSVATRLFGEKGLKATTIRDISKACGLNISLISYHFGGKMDLYRTIIIEHAEKVRAQVDHLVQNHSNDRLTPEIFNKEITSIIRQLVEMRMNSVHLAKIFMAERAQQMPHAREAFEDLMEPTVEKVASLIARGQKKGFIRADFPPRVFMLVMIESIFGYFMVADCQLKIWRDIYKMPEDKEKLIQFLSQTLTRGILK